MPIRDQNSKITIEDLLRLKRTEQPDAKFWANFEQELRQKQLTALVKKRRIWHDIPLLLSKRFYLPASAAAIVAVTVISVQNSTSSQFVEGEEYSSPVAVSTSSIEILDPIEVAVVKSAVARPSAEAVAQHSDTQVATNTPAVASKQGSGDSRAASQHLVASRAKDSRLENGISASFVNLANMDSDLMNTALNNRLGPETQSPQAVHAQSDLLAQSNSNSSKYRLIARYAESSLSPEPMAPAIVRERLARRLGDDIGDNVSRIGVVGSRVSLKF